MRRALLLAVIIAVLSCGADALAAPAAALVPARPRICLVLSGGGARGEAHVGVLKVLETLRVPVDCIVGTSGGAIMGGLYSAGMSPEQIQQWLEQMDWSTALQDSPPRRSLSFRRKQDDLTYLFNLQLGYRDGELRLPRALIAGQNLDYILKSVTIEKGRARDFASLNLPFRAVATDLTDGEMVVLDHGSLAEALRASMSVPGVFAPVEMDGHLLVDGGLVRNLPVQLAREMGADVVIAVDVGTPLEGREALASPLGLSVQTVTVLTRQNVGQSLKQLKAGDILIRPAMGDITALDFSRTDEAVERGEAATWKVADRLTQLALDEKDYQAWLARQRHHGPETLPVIDTIRIRGNRRVSEKLIMSRIRTRPGQRLDMRTLHGDLQAVFSVGDFSHVDFSLEDKQDGHADLVYRVEEKGWGPNYLRFGLNIADDLEGSSHYNLLFSHTLTQVDALGAEWKNELQIGETRRVFSEFFQPLDYRGRFFVAPQLEYQNDSFHLYDQGRPISEYRTRLLQGALDAGWQAGNYGELRIGLERSRLDTELRVGPPDVPTERYDLSGFRLRAIYDQIDNPSFPREGSFVRLDGLYPRPGLGADLSFERLHLSAITAGSYGRNTLMLSVEAGDTAGDALPVAAQFTLGGFLSLSGYKERQLRGQELFAGRLIFYREVHALPPVVGSGIYFGGSLEAGNVWNSRSEVSVSDLRYGSSIFMGMDTVLGALYLGVGLAQNGNQAFYLSLGRSF